MPGLSARRLQTKTWTYGMEVVAGITAALFLHGCRVQGEGAEYGAVSGRNSTIAFRHLNIHSWPLVYLGKLFACCVEATLQDSASCGHACTYDEDV